MAKSSINFQKASGHSTEHNFRKDKPNYLLPKEFQKENEFWQHEKLEQEIFDDELSKAKRKGGRKPKLENSRWEAVLNLNSNHDLKDVKKVAEHIEEEFNITCSAIAIHRDEGFVDDNNKPQYNYHAHINFVTYKDGRQNWRKEHIKPQMLSELQTKVAELLVMDRGEIGSKSVRLEHKQHRAVKKREDKLLAKQKDLKVEISRLRAELQEQGAVREDYAKLEQLNKDLKEQIKAKDLTVDELKEKLQTANTRVLNGENRIKIENQKHEETKKQLSEARETILEQEATIDSKKQEKELLEQNMSDLEHKNSILELEKDGLKDNLQNLETELGYSQKKNRDLGKKLKESYEQIFELKETIEKNKQMTRTIGILEAKVSELELAVKSKDTSKPEPLILKSKQSEIDIQEVERFMRGASYSNQRVARDYLIVRKKYEEFRVCEDSPVLLDILRSRGIDVAKLKYELETCEEDLRKVMRFRTPFKNRDFELENEQEISSSPRF